VGGRSEKVLGDALIQEDRNEQHVSDRSTHSIYGHPPIVDYNITSQQMLEEPRTTNTNTLDLVYIQYYNR
jgi:hypothetical protein